MFRAVRDNTRPLLLCLCKMQADAFPVAGESNCKLLQARWCSKHYEDESLRSTSVLHGRSYKGLAPPRKAKTKQNKEYPLSTQTTVTRHSSQIKHRTPPQHQPASQVTCHAPAQEPCTLVRAPGTHYTDPVGLSPGSSQSTQPSARRRRAVPHCHTDTTHWHNS